jgi:choline kinase
MTSAIGRTQVVILAAGLGTRLKELTSERPKAMLEIAGTTLVDLALEFGKALAPAAQVIVVGGYRFELLKAHQAKASCEYHLLENTAFRSGSIYSLLTALPEISRSFYLLNADHIFPPESAPLFQAGTGNAISIFCDQTRVLGDDDMKVKTQDDRSCVKDMSKTLGQYDYGYIGVTHVPASWLETYYSAARDVPSVFGEAASVEKVVQLLVDRGSNIICSLVNGIGWNEVDTPEDYERAIANSWVSKRAGTIRG